jgi:hypothetical protein
MAAGRVDRAEAVAQPGDELLQAPVVILVAGPQPAGRPHQPVAGAQDRLAGGIDMQQASRGIHQDDAEVQPVKHMPGHGGLRIDGLQALPHFQRALQVRQQTVQQPDLTRREVARVMRPVDAHRGVTPAMQRQHRAREIAYVHARPPHVLVVDVTFQQHAILDHVGTDHGLAHHPPLERAQRPHVVPSKVCVFLDDLGTHAEHHHDIRRRMSGIVR